MPELTQENTIEDISKSNPTRTTMGMLATTAETLIMKTIVTEEEKGYLPHLGSKTKAITRDGKGQKKVKRNDAFGDDVSIGQLLDE